MSLNTSKMILKVTGIISIIFGIIGIIAGLAAILGGGAVGYGLVSEGTAANQDMATGIGLLVGGGLLILVMCIVELVQGIFSVKAANNISKIMPAWVFALISLVLSAINTISAFANKSQDLLSNVVALVISVLIFIAANNIKKSAGK